MSELPPKPSIASAFLLDCKKSAHCDEAQGTRYATKRTPLRNRTSIDRVHDYRASLVARLQFYRKTRRAWRCNPSQNCREADFPGIFCSGRVRIGPIFGFGGNSSLHHLPSKREGSTSDEGISLLPALCLQPLCMLSGSGAPIPETHVGSLHGRSGLVYAMRPNLMQIQASSQWTNASTYLTPAPFSIESDPPTAFQTTHCFHVEKSTHCVWIVLAQAVIHQCS